MRLTKLQRRELVPPLDLVMSMRSTHRTPARLAGRATERRVFHLIRQRGPISRAALAAMTGLSAQAIGTTVRRLLQLGLVEETGPEARAGLGRHPVGVAIRPEGAHAFGCSVERDRIDAVWIDLDGVPVAGENVAIVPGEEPRRTVARIERLHARLTAKAGLDAARGIVLPAIGLGLPGPIDFTAGRLVNPPNFPHWEGIAPRAVFSESWTHPVLLENSATAAALGEAWRSRGELTNFLYCHWGLGVGGGFVSDFETYRGQTGSGLELGHIVVVPGGARCGCGGNGCLEAEASVSALCRQATELGFGSDFDDLVARTGSELELARLFDRAADLLGQALVGGVNLFDVDKVVLGGHHLQAVADRFVPRVAAALRDYPLRRVIRPVALECSALGEAAGAIGAASVVFDALLPSDVRPPAERRAAAEAVG